MKLHLAVLGYLMLQSFVIVVGALLWSSPVCLAQTNSWSSPASGHWEDSAWSLGILPAANQSVFITNAGFKAVGISSTTAANFPGAMTVNDLTVSAPSNSQNTLLLNFVGTAVPLQVTNDCVIGTNGGILNLSPSLWIGQNFSITSGGKFRSAGWFDGFHESVVG